MGETPLVDDLTALCIDAGHTTVAFTSEDVMQETGLTRLGDDAHTADFALECLVDSIDLKRDVVRSLDRSLPPDRLLLSTSLSVTATQIAAWIAHPDRVVGLGALPPIGKGNLIELAAGLQTHSAWLDNAQQFFSDLGLETAVVQDSVGLVLPRIVCGLVNEAAYALMEDVAQARDIDTAMKLGTNYPRGPLEWGDLIGLDIVLAVLRGLFDEYGDDHYRPAPLLKQFVRAGWLGKKSGRGFYEYGDQGLGSRD
ncbi:MAG: 3-hydroxyacyl-CoA dehydrogenase family protein [Anaerolineae bacterium]